MYYDNKINSLKSGKKQRKRKVQSVLSDILLNGLLGCIFGYAGFRLSYLLYSIFIDLLWSFSDFGGSRDLFLKYEINIYRMILYFSILISTIVGMMRGLINRQLFFSGIKIRPIHIGILSGLCVAVFCCLVYIPDLLLEGTIDGAPGRPDNVFIAITTIYLSLLFICPFVGALVGRLYTLVITMFRPKII